MVSGLTSFGLSMSQAGFGLASFEFRVQGLGGCVRSLVGSGSDVPHARKSLFAWLRLASPSPITSGFLLRVSDFGNQQLQ